MMRDRIVVGIVGVIAMTGGCSFDPGGDEGMEVSPKGDADLGTLETDVSSASDTSIGPVVDSGRLDGRPVGDTATRPTDGGEAELEDGDVSEVDTSDDTDADIGGTTGYPSRSAYRIKAIQPDFWSDKREIAGNNTGGVAMNLVWDQWESSKVTDRSACRGDDKVFYDGHCFQVHGATDAAIREWTNLGVNVTAVVYGVPEWARSRSHCNDAGHFCAPDDSDDFGRFAGMVAERYDGESGHGRIVDFVIHNEVNSNNWYDVGCGGGVPCDPNAWIKTYTDDFNAAYDAIKRHQPSAKVLIPLTHHFGTTFDRPSATHPKLSGKTFLRKFTRGVGNREWQVALHPYPPDLLKPEFGADDAPHVTYGNLGMLVGWLRATFPTDPHAWRIQLTESGVNSKRPHSSEQIQAEAVCDSFRNVLGTPWIENYIYHRMKDHRAEVDAGLALGLRDEDGAPKKAWSVWASANRNDLNPPKLDCGFEHLPHTVLRRSSHSRRGHWASTRLAPEGFSHEQSYRLFRAEKSETRMLFECGIGDHNFVSKDPECEGRAPRGPLGYAYTKEKPGTVPLYRCRIGDGDDHFISTDANCEGRNKDTQLGWVLPGP